jgi:hypothetical protein
MPNGTEMAADSRELWGNAVDEPDPLVYWTNRQSANLSEARLVGTLDQGRRLGLHIPSAGGFLILYSLAHQKLLATAPMPKEVR